MNILGILMMYNDLLENPNMQFHPMTFIFGAKAAAGYKEMKNVIKLINKTADLINNDGRVNDKMKIVFIENYNVSKAELIIPAADLSEQISTASKEASGTSNMKFALNGALTLGTEDGANVEIHENVGDDNIFIFGLNANEVMYRYNNMHDFSTRHILETNKKINKAMNMLIDGSIPGLNGAGHDIYRTLVNNDYFFVLTDLPHYIEAKYKANHLYSENQRKWIQMCLANIANNHFFTTDRTISEYYKDIWNK
jgi:starch phosphorylase